MGPLYFFRSTNISLSYLQLKIKFNYRLLQFSFFKLEYSTHVFYRSYDQFTYCLLLPPAASLADFSNLHEFFSEYIAILKSDNVFQERRSFDIWCQDYFFKLKQWKVIGILSTKDVMDDDDHKLQAYCAMTIENLIVWTKLF